MAHWITPQGEAELFAACFAPDGTPTLAFWQQHTQHVFDNHRRDSMSSHISNSQRVLEIQLRRKQDEMAVLEQKLAMLEAFDEPAEDGAVIRFDVQFDVSGRVYSYAAIRTNNRWYTTGPQGGNTPRTWDALVNWLIDRKVPTTEIWLVTEYEALHS